MKVTCILYKPLFERNEKKYLEIELNSVDLENAEKNHKKTIKFIQNKKIKNPLEDNILEVKVPYKYKKLACKVSGLKQIGEYTIGDQVTLDIEYCGVWNIGEWSGFAWKVNEIF